MKVFSATIFASFLYTLSYALPSPGSVAKVGDNPDVEIFSKRGIEEREVVANPKTRPDWRVATTTTTTTARTRPNWRATTTSPSFYIAPVPTTTPASSSSTLPAFVPAPVSSTTSSPAFVPAPASISTSIPAIATVSTLAPATTMTTTPPAAVATPATAALAAALTEHNRFRALHGAVPLVWDATLATAAASWASRCVFQHSQGAVGPYGENLAASAGTGTSVSPPLVNALIKLWEDEAADYTPATPNYSHFTQMVWKATTKLGCALQVCAPGTLFDAAYGNGYFLTCEYQSPGNIYPAANFLINVQP